MTTLKCACGKEFQPRSGNQVYCSTKCTKLYYKLAPKHCECGNPGVFKFGSEDECQRCRELRQEREREQQRRRGIHLRQDHDATFGFDDWKEFCVEWLRENAIREFRLRWREHMHNEVVALTHEKSHA